MLDYRKLEAFCKVYELHSFSRAGNELFLSQPTISAHVLSLEKELEVQLFDRMGRGVMPTAAGDILFTHAKQAFACLDGARAEISQLQDEVTGQIMVGGSTIPAHYLLPSVLASYRDMHPKVQVGLTIADTEGITEQVADGSVTVGIVGAADGRADLHYEPLVDDELVLIATAGVFAEGTELGLNELAAHPWVMRESGSGTRKAIERALLDRGGDIRRLEVGISVDSTQAVVQCVQAGLGISMTSRLVAEAPARRGEIAIVPVRDFIVRRQFYCVYHEKRHFFPAVTGFISHLLEKTAPLRGK